MNQTESKQAEDQIEKPKIKLTMTNMKVVATWNYTAKNSNCELCHIDLMNPIQESGSNRMNGDVIIGNCLHGFHSVCINSWLTQNNTKCPCCHTLWKSNKVVGSSVYVYKSTV